MHCESVMVLSAALDCVAQIRSKERTTGGTRGRRSSRKSPQAVVVSEAVEGCLKCHRDVDYQQVRTQDGDSTWFRFPWL